MNQAGSQPHKKNVNDECFAAVMSLLIDSVLKKAEAEKMEDGQADNLTRWPIQAPTELWRGQVRWSYVIFGFIQNLSSLAFRLFVFLNFITFSDYWGRIFGYCVKISAGTWLVSVIVLLIQMYLDGIFEIPQLR